MTSSNRCPCGEPATVISKFGASFCLAHWVEQQMATKKPDGDGCPHSIGIDRHCGIPIFSATGLCYTHWREAGKLKRCGQESASGVRCGRVTTHWEPGPSGLRPRCDLHRGPMYAAPSDLPPPPLLLEESEMAYTRYEDDEEPDEYTKTVKPVAKAAVKAALDKKLVELEVARELAAYESFGEDTYSDGTAIRFVLQHKKNGKRYVYLALKVVADGNEHWHLTDGSTHTWDSLKRVLIQANPVPVLDVLVPQQTPDAVPPPDVDEFLADPSTGTVRSRPE